MPQRIATISLICIVQIAAAGLGAAWGLGVAHRVIWIRVPWSLAGELAVLLMVAEGIRQGVPLASGKVPAAALGICAALGAFAVSLMMGEAFLDYRGDESFIRGLLLILPYVVAVGPLVRGRAWLGVAGSALFFATALAMLISNGFSRLGGSGFFATWIS